MIDFKFKPFDQMTPEDYAIVGFKSGLEIHQQLLTDKKLFCRCPAGEYSDEYDAEILRHMRPTLSELGEYDGTALMEFKTKKEIIYRIHHDSVCTYEMDDTPPFLMNQQALDIAIELGMLCGCNIVDEIHIARKQYLDGSIPTGFQRTAIYALDGKLPYKDREIEIIQMSIEEDSCREVSDIGHRRIYLTDRLGMPLIETVTGPDMRTPQEVAEVNQLCRKLVRSSGHVRTGIGAARQDVNVSVDGGTRVEIKGVSKIGLIPLLTYNEAMRQWNLLRLREELRNRGINNETFKADSVDITRLLKNPHYLPIVEAVRKGLLVKCVKLEGFGGLLNRQTQTNTYFSKEISDRVRVIACLTNIPNILHSDSRGDNLTSSEWMEISKAAGATDDDALVIVWGNKSDIETAVNEIIIRAREATMGVPSETRQALRDGTNGFERILPGPDRMYPDTDLPPKKITDNQLEKIRAGLPAFFWEREAWYKELGVPEDIIPYLSISRFAGLFSFLVKEWNISPVLASSALVRFPKRLAKQGYDTAKITESLMRDIFTAYKDGDLVRDGIYYAMKDAVDNGSFDSGFAKPADENEIHDAIQQCRKQINLIEVYHPEKRNQILMGMVMDILRGRANGAAVIDEISKL